MADPSPIPQIRSILNSVIDGDPELGALHNDVEYRNPDYAMEGGVRRGPEQVTTAVRSLFELIDYSALTIGRWAVRPPREAVLEVKLIGAGKGSGAPVEQTFGCHFTYDDEMRLKRYSWFLTWEEVLAEAGVTRDEWEFCE